MHCEQTAPNNAHTHTPDTHSLTLMNATPTSPRPHCRTVASLSSRVEVLEGSLKQLKLTNISPGLPDPGNTPVRRRRDSRRSNGGQRWSKESGSSSTALPPVTESRRTGMDVTWQMPFTLKCIGTFR